RCRVSLLTPKKIASLRQLQCVEPSVGFLRVVARIFARSAGLKVPRCSLPLFFRRFSNDVDYARLSLAHGLLYCVQKLTILTRFLPGALAHPLIKTDLADARARSGMPGGMVYAGISPDNVKRTHTTPAKAREPLRSLRTNLAVRPALRDILVS